LLNAWIGESPSIVSEARVTLIDQFALQKSAKAELSSTFALFEGRL
jgi:hypothetical protein